MILEFDAVSLRFGGLSAISNLSLAIRPKIITSIIGPNGAGKTSVFNVMSGVYPATSGTIRFCGEPRSHTRTWHFWLLCIVALLSGAVLAPLLWNCTDLWQVMINDAFIMDSHFSWSEAFSRGLSYIQQISPAYLAAESLGGALFGISFAMIWTHNQTQSLEAIARSGIGRTFQNIRLFSDLTCYDNLRCAAEQHAQDYTMLRFSIIHFHAHRRDIDSRCDELLSFAGLTEYRDLPPHTLPYGLQRKLEIVRALATQPKLLLLDEPAAGLNPTESRELMRFIREIQSRGVTIVVIEHDMKLVMEISDHIIVLHHGEKLAEGAPIDIQRNEAVIQAYLGGSQA
jgi:ABC-type branched-subunit amino acid transport system ATPase component